jgi:hypothetical protein
MTTPTSCLLFPWLRDRHWPTKSALERKNDIQDPDDVFVDIDSVFSVMGASVDL